ncbi:MAG TPA: hypothetical protein VHY30_11120 [Verrucomicrobiae bacterium]|jgi:hypothetical protein|nr:hypothetical protein [Verrucomicrobiae bacterium]
MSRAVKCFLLFALGVILISVSGCSTNEPQNASVRPWNAPQSWESGLPIDMGQHE